MVWVHKISDWFTVSVYNSSEQMLAHVLITLHARNYCVTDKTLTEDRRCNVLFTEPSKTPTLCAPSPHMPIFQDRDTYIVGCWLFQHIHIHVFPMLCVAGIPLFDRSVFTVIDKMSVRQTRLLISQ